MNIDKPLTVYWTPATLVSQLTKRVSASTETESCTTAGGNGDGDDDGDGRMIVRMIVQAACTTN